MDLQNLLQHLLPELASSEQAPHGEAAEAPPGEQVDVLVEHGNLRIERIVSTGQASPEGFWYDQEEHEWVLLLSGSAGLRFEGEDGPRALGPGDQAHIPAHTRHRVEWTAEGEHTIWLAIFYR